MAADETFPEPRVYVSSDATGGPGAWREAQMPDDSYLGPVVCPSRQLCVLGPGGGFAVVSRDPLFGPWTGYPINGGPRLDDVSCPTASLCVAVDKLGDVLTSSDPGGGAAAWQTSLIDPQRDLQSVSCPTSSLCVAVDESDGVLTSTDPTGGASAWSFAEVDQGGGLFSVSCPTSTLCVAADDSGQVFTSTNPTGGAGAWSSASIDPGYGLDAVTCPSATFCLAGDWTGDVLDSTDPTGGPSAWHRTALSPGGAARVTGASCPSSQLCLVSTTAELYTSTDPSADAPSWQPQTVLAAESAVGCASTTLCVAGSSGAFATSGELLGSTDPTGGRPVWLRDGVTPLSFVTAISCVPGTTTCVAGDNEGEVLTSH